MKILLCLVSICIIGCSNGSKSKQALMKMGFTEIETTGHAFFACSDDDFYCTGFIAKNPQGMKVEGAIGCGFFMKNCTLRL